MLFSSTIFLFLFLPLVLLIYYNPIIKNRTFKNVFLTCASLLFYAWGEPKFVFVMMLSILMNWFLAILVDKYRENKKVKIILIVAVIANIGLLFIFKYLNFTVETINSTFNTNIVLKKITLPIGISFFSFQALSYVIDVYRKNGKVQKNPLNVALYISLFPQLIAGPIVRYETVAKEINDRKENIEDFSNGVLRFIVGFCKKVLIANNLALVADKAFSLVGNELSVGMAWIGAFAYAFQIFFDFGGYSDMAIGLGKMFGFHFLENFNYPYISKSVSEFWRRWHISLGTWFRDYVYFPLGGSRVKTKLRLVFNLFVVWSLTGLWHGANWTFIVWGLMYFVLLTLEKVFGIDKKMRKFSYLYTMIFVLIGWVIFRADSIQIAFTYLKTMIGIGSNGFIDDQLILYISLYKYYFIAAILCSFPLKELISKKMKLQGKIYNTLSTICIMVLFIVSISFLVKGSYNPFIYFNF